MSVNSWIRLTFVFCLALTACSTSPQAGVVVEWTTATEIDTAGFNLYRSEQAGGTYTKINSALIPASTDPLRGGKYRYEDRDALPGRIYYYKLEDVELDGTTTLHGPIQASAGSNSGADAAILLIGAGALAIIGLAALAVRRRGKNRQADSDRRDEGK